MRLCSPPAWPPGQAAIIGCPWLQPRPGRQPRRQPPPATRPGPGPGGGRRRGDRRAMKNVPLKKIIAQFCIYCSILSTILERLGLQMPGGDRATVTQAPTADQLLYSETSARQTRPVHALWSILSRPARSRDCCGHRDGPGGRGPTRQGCDSDNDWPRWFCAELLRGALHRRLAREGD